MSFFPIIIIFCFGLIIGSFLNVVIARYNSGLSMFRGRSVCFSCNRTLSALELVPLVSFLFQGGKCRSCEAKISWQYPIVEILTAVVFILLYIKVYPIAFEGWILYILYLVIFSLLIALSGYDLKHKIIPDGLSFSFSSLALLSGLLYQLSTENYQLLSYLLSGPILALFFFTLWLITRGKGIGLGDAKLALGIGWLLGLSSGASAVLLAFWIGALASLAAIAIGKLAQRLNAQGSMLNLGMKSEIPFGPYLIIGTAIAFFFDINFVVISGWLPFGV